MITALRQYRATLAERLAHMQTRRQAQQPLPYFVEALFDYSAALIKAELAWVEKFIKQVEDETNA